MPDNPVAPDLPKYLAEAEAPPCLSNLMRLRDKVTACSFQGSASELVLLVDDLVKVSLFLRCRQNTDGGVTLTKAEVARLLEIVERAR